jgi:hypothetical protein
MKDLADPCLPDFACATLKAYTGFPSMITTFPNTCYGTSFFFITIVTGSSSTLSTYALSALSIAISVVSEDST